MSENIQCTKCGKAGIDPDKHSCLKDAQAEISALKEKLYKAEVARDGWMKNCDLRDAEIARLKAEVERLKTETWYSSYYQVLARAESAEAKLEKVKNLLPQLDGKSTLGNALWDVKQILKDETP